MGRVHRNLIVKPRTTGMYATVHVKTQISVAGHAKAHVHSVAIGVYHTVIVYFGRRDI